MVTKGNNGEAWIKELEDKLENLTEFSSDDSKGISKLRQWLSELHNDKNKAGFMLKRMESANEKLYKALNLSEAIKIKVKKTIIQDLIHLHTFKTQTDDN